jgi:hypothetical protein
LADKSSIATDDELLAKCLQKTNVITSMEIPVFDTLSIYYVHRVEIIILYCTPSCEGIDYSVFDHQRST